MTYSKYTFLFSLLLFSACAQAGSPAEEVPKEPAVMTEAEATDTASQPSDNPEPPKATVPAAEDNSVAQTTKPVNPGQTAVTKAEKRIAAPADKAPEEPAPEPNKPSHEGWDALLRKHVTKVGNVDYAGFQEDKSKLQTYLNRLAEERPQPSWGRNARLAYWINAYNAFTVKLILDHYPVSSIRDIYGGKPWDKKWIELDGETFSLNQIEHEIIRKRFDEARIHFAVNCAARSCPPLINRAFTAGNLEEMLEEATREFLNNPSYNKIDTKQAQLSKIFDWYGSDFGNINQFLEKYVPNKINPDTPIEFLEYDWALNEQQ